VNHEALAILHKAKSNPFFARAVSTEDYRTAVALREQAMSHRANLPAVNAPPEPTNTDGLDDWVNAVSRARVAEQDGEYRYNALTSVINTCNSRISAVVDVDTDQVLGALSDQMTDLMADVDTAVAALNGARTASEVIAADVGDAWNELRSLRASYDLLRDAQIFVMQDAMASHASYYLYGDAHASRLYIRNIDEVFPGWQTPDTSSVSLVAPPPDPRPWPTDDPVAQLVWLSSSNAEVWLPTLHDLAVLQQELHRKHNPEPAQVQPGRRDKPMQQTLGARRHNRIVQA
jgi:hypothetical protein